MRRILGIDPGLQITGYGIVDLPDGLLEPTLVEAGVIRLSPRLSMQRRLGQLHTDLTELIEQFEPHTLSLEKLYAHYKHPRTAILMAHARGVVMLAAEQAHVAMVHLPATAVKKAITGYGHASKLQMQQSIQSQCRLAELPSPPDVADAIGIALTCARRMAIEEL